MSKGSSQPAGQTTVTNPSQVAQQPYLNYGYEQAKNQLQNTPYYPGSTTAPYYAPNPLQAQGYNALANAGQQSAQTLQPAANTVFNEAATRQYGGPANPAYGGYMGLAYGDSYTPQNFGNLQAQSQWGGQNYANQIGQYAPEMQDIGRSGAATGQDYASRIAGFADPLTQYAQAAGANNNLGLSQLGRSASGEYVGQNPYLAGAMQAAIDPVTRNYQTAIAPGIDAAAAQSGRGRSGAVAGMANTAQQNLLRETGNITQEMSNANLARERQLQDAAAQQYGSLYNAGLGLGMQGMQNAAGLQQQAGQMGLAGLDRQQTGLLNAANAQGAAGNQFFAGQRGAQDAANQYAQTQQTGLAGLSSGFNTQNQNAMAAMSALPQLAAANQQGARAQIEAGQGLTAQDQQYRQYHQAKIAEDMARYNYPQQQLKDYMELIGNPLPGSTSTPYYRNQGAEVMSGITGALGIGKTLLAPATGGLSKI